MGYNFLKNVPWDRMGWDGMGWDRPIPRGALLYTYASMYTFFHVCIDRTIEVLLFQMNKIDLLKSNHHSDRQTNKYEI